MLLLGFVLNLIKTLAINTNHGTLTDKGMWIYLADKTEDSWSLALLGQHKQHSFHPHYRDFNTTTR